MSRFAVECGNLDGQAGVLGSIANSLRQRESDVLSVRYDITSTMDFAQAVEVDSQLCRVANAIDALGSKTDLFETQLRAIISQYQRTENKILDYSSDDTSTATGGHSRSASFGVEDDGSSSRSGGSYGSGAHSRSASFETDSAFDMKWGDLVSGVIGKFGEIGSSILTGYQLVQGVSKLNATTAEITVSWLKFINSNISTLNKVVNPFQKNSVVSSSVRAAYDSLVDNKLDELGFVDKSKGAVINSATKWAGLILSFVSSGIKNAQKCASGEISEQRAILNTVNEPVVNFCINTGAEAIATTAAAALGISPAGIAVGAATIGIVWGANTLTRAITKAQGNERDLTEVIVDVAGDAEEKILEVAGDAKDVILDVASDAKEAILDTGEAIYEGGKQVVSGIKNAITNTGNVFCRWVLA